MRRMALAGFVLVLAACAPDGDLPRPGTAAQAEAIASAWLTAVARDDGDRGWSLLHPLARTRHFGDSQARYQAELETLDWTGFRWQLDAPARLDGNYRVTFVLEGDTTPASGLAGGRLIQLVPSDDGIRRATVTILIDFDGTAGVL